MLLPLLIALVVALVALLALLAPSGEKISTQRWQPLERGVNWLATVLAAIAAGYVLVVPFYSTVTVTSSTTGPGSQVTEYGSETLLSVNGPRVLPVVLLPVVLAAIPLLRGTPHQRRVRSAVVAVLLVGFTILGGFTIGLFYVPSALAMLVLAIIGAVLERTA